MPGIKTNQKRPYIRRPGLKADAVKLGVRYEHLRMVVMGIRESKKLLNAYLALHQEATADLKPAPTHPH